MLSWMERKVATLLFGEALKSTFTEALENFMMAENLLPGVWIENMLHIAKVINFMWKSSQKSHLSKYTLNYLRNKLHQIKISR